MTDLKRRQLMGLMGATAVAIPVSAVIGTLPSHADDTPMVDPSTPQATALQYIEMSDKGEQKCSSCTLYQGAADSEAGPCPLFPGNNVTAAGWCSAYVPRA